MLAAYKELTTPYSYTGDYLVSRPVSPFGSYSTTIEGHYRGKTAHPAQMLWVRKLHQMINLNAIAVLEPSVS